MKNFFSTHWPKILLGIYLLEFILLGINPSYRTVWMVENSIALVTVVTLVTMYWHGIRFSNLAYTFVALLIYLHTVGGHYTFAEVPFGAITEFFGFSRNNFDRVCHFLVGVFAFPALEFFEKRQLIRGRRLAIFLVVLGIFGWSAIFEIVEWLYAIIADSKAGTAFLGSQGDPWDAQKDMLAAGIGSIFFAFIYVTMNRRKSQPES